MLSWYSFHSVKSKPRKSVSRIPHRRRRYVVLVTIGIGLTFDDNEILKPPIKS